VEIKKIEHKARRDGRPVTTYKIRYKETVRDPATGQPTGQVRSRSETYPTHEAAKERRREIENQRAATGNVVGREARQEPFGTFAGMWLDAHAGLVKARTLLEYRRLYECYVAPEFAARAVGTITPADARRFRAELVSRGLARGTIKHAWDTFRRILDLAVLDGAISANPSASVPLPRRGAVGDDEPFTAHPLTGQQVAAVAGHISTRYPLYGLVVLFLAYSGLRAAEFAGLEIADVDLDRGTVRVQRTKSKVRGGWDVGTPKSRKSRRVVPLDDWLVEDLREHLAAHPRRDDPSAPLFPARYGRNAPGVPRSALTATPDTRATVESYNWAAPLDPGTFYSNYFKPALVAVGLPASAAGVSGVRLHDLRHTFAVLSLSAGTHYMQVSKYLGHESYVTTLNVYGDYIDEAEGGKGTPLARPTAAPASPSVEDAPASNVISLASRRKTG